MSTSSKHAGSKPHVHRVGVRRAYEEPGADDGYRVLVDHFWPRGCRKETLRLDAWVRELAPSAELIHWFGHDVARWDEFRARYKAQLAGAEPQRQLHALLAAAGDRRITLVYGARDQQHNQALVLREVLEALARESR